MKLGSAKILFKTIFILGIGFKVVASAASASSLQPQNLQSPTAGSPSQISSQEANAPIGVSFAPVPIAPTAKRFSGSVSLDRTSNLFREGDAGFASSNNVSFLPSFKLSERWSLSSLMIVSQDLQEEEVDMTDTPLSLNLNTYVFSNSKFNLTNSIAAILPTSKASQEDTLLQGGLVLTQNLNYAGPIFSWTARASVRQNSHEFTVSNSFQPNIQRTAAARFLLKASLGDKWILESDSLYTRRWTYRGFESDTFRQILGASYSATEQLSLDLSTTNEGSALAANGKDSNLALFNENASTISGGLTYEF